jgi:3,4-dehydroadipyl-CoA semialdehyde dehydrogenase
VITIRSYLCDRFQEGTGEPGVLLNPATEEPLAGTSTAGLDLAAAVRHGREVGGPELRGMTFGERAALLTRMAKALHERREELLDLAIANGGNTRSDAKFDVDGATGTLAAYGRLGEPLGDRRVLVDGGGVALGRSSRFYGMHLLTPREGVAVLINAYNFPAWGFAEKAACALLAGMPVLCKPATSTALVTARMVEALVEADLLPAGAIQLVAGPAGDLLDHLGPQDVVAFTGSAATGLGIRSRENLLRSSVPVNVEADSLNAAVLAPDVEAGSDTFGLFLKDVVRELTQKAGQKCTAVRRVLVPADRVDEVQEELRERLAGLVVGDPADRDVRMGPLATRNQLEDAREGIAELAAEGRVALGGPEAVEARGVPAGKGFFVAPTLIRLEDGDAAEAVHRREVFGPVATLVPYDGTAAAAARLVARGEGCLVSSAYGDDRAWLESLVLGTAAWNGRLYLGTAKVADQAPGSGVALPFLNHGGPGRAGGGSELGGLHGLRLYQHRTAVQGGRGLLERLFPPSAD